MSSPKHPRKKRASFINIDQHNSETRSRNIRHEIRIAEKKMDKLLTRNKSGKVATPGRQKIWDDSHKNVVKVLEKPKKQGIVSGGERHERLQKHIKSLKSMLKE